MKKHTKVFLNKEKKQSDVTNIRKYKVEDCHISKNKFSDNVQNNKH